ncbi:MAG: hypothetical protein IPG08_03580 [Sphingobacteriaceae bacterium]|nr:hypothetical protein [Sphingobacteriaceae bacterium]
MSDLKNKKARILYIISLACGIWFLAFGWAWTDLGNLIIAYPFWFNRFFALALR